MTGEPLYPAEEELTYEQRRAARERRAYEELKAYQEQQAQEQQRSYQEQQQAYQEQQTYQEQQRAYQEQQRAYQEQQQAYQEQQARQQQQQYAEQQQYVEQQQHDPEPEPAYESGSFLSDDDYGNDPATDTSGGGSRRRRPKKKRGGGARWLVVLLVLGLFVGAGWFAVGKGMDAWNSLFADAPDYPGPGSGSVMVEVKSGDSAAAIGRTLKSAGVVASVDAFIDAASQNPDSGGIQVGHYQLKKKMKASDALAVLINPKNIVASGVTIPEGYTVEQTIEKIAKETDFKEAELRKLVEKRSGLGLPAYAEGNPEGFLFPSTYDVKPDMTAAGLLQEMVKKFKDEAGSTVSKASSVDLTEHELVILASIIEKEVRRPQDLPAVAEVALNRLSGACSDQGVPQGRLQMDSTVHYIEGENGSVFTTDEMRNNQSEYNTYEHDGLPPGPIAAPGLAALKAALNPTDEGYCYFVAVNLKSGETLFAQSISDHETNRAKLDEWCADNPDYDC
ncbi:endolytic transglycosylase MltG [Nocardioides speluncae]|uniref:endolytic transglycosylase MltG n=1 Tax=Nocardioides speluncae TaxID=2670337 RepID=UPI000D687A7A|nr:endolytic transglycosylase MltG [Nocardioides speluncae]